MRPEAKLVLSLLEGIDAGTQEQLLIDDAVTQLAAALQLPQMRSVHAKCPAPFQMLIQLVCW